MRKITLIILCCLTFMSCGKTDEPATQKTAEAVPFIDVTREITIVTSDSLRLTAWFTPSPDSGRVPLIATLPMLGQTHESYLPFIDSLKKYLETDTALSGQVVPHLLNFDLRGHGRSILKGTDTLTFENMSEAEFAKIPDDISLMLEKVINDYHDRLDTSRITIVGASIGANAAVMTATSIPYISRAVMLSPGTDYRSLKPADAFKNFTGKTFLATSRADRYSYETVQRLAALKKKDWILKIYPRDSHGTDLLKYDIAMRDVIKWIFEK